MRISYKWLQSLLGFDNEKPEYSADAIAEWLTMSGSSVESIEAKGKEIRGIVSAQILEAKPIDGAEHLVACIIDAGGYQANVVCGAPNARTGLNVLFAPAGAVIAGEKLIKKTSIRDVESEGMLLAEDELGISENHDGIIELTDDIKPGTPLEKIIDLTDTIFDLEITPNRPDCLSHLGVARELKALTGWPLKYTVTCPVEADSLTASMLELEIADPDGCPRYTARIVTGIKVRPSPLWLKLKLHYLGIRPINNVVDVTNYVMLETGQPLHAFDYDRLAERKIVVRRAEKDEKFITLDGVERRLCPEHLLITDGKRPVALAGIMGGADSEVTDNTKTILIESAYFDPVTIRRGARMIGLSTESSLRFERGMDIEMAPKANDRAAALAQELCGGNVLAGIMDFYSKRFKPAVFEFRPERAIAVIGTRIEVERMKEILDGLDIGYSNGDRMEITQPSFRPDLTREIDVIEEIARINGLDKIPQSYRAGGSLLKQPQAKQEKINSLRTFLVGRGFIETFQLTLIDGNRIQKIFPELPIVKLKNPLSEELSALRPDLLCSMIRTLRHNLNHGNRDLFLFETGNVFLPLDGGGVSETNRLCLGFSGLARPMSWHHQLSQCDLFTVAGELELVAGHLDLGRFDLQPYPCGYFDDEYSFRICYNDTTVGRLGRLAPAIARHFGIKQECFMAEIELERMLSLPESAKCHKPLPKYPGTERDIAIVVDAAVQCAGIMALISKTGGALVEEVFPFDLYKRENIGQNKKSMAFRLKFRSLERTLTDAEVDQVMKEIIAALKQEAGAELRA